MAESDNESFETQSNSSEASLARWLKVLTGVTSNISTHESQAQEISIVEPENETIILISDSECEESDTSNQPSTSRPKLSKETQSTKPSSKKNCRHHDKNSSRARAQISTSRHQSNLRSTDRFSNNSHSVSCEICSAKLCNLGGLRAHLRKKHKLSQEELTIVLDKFDKRKYKIPCYFCKKSYCTTGNCFDHLIKTHKMSPAEAKQIAKKYGLNFTCSICGMSYKLEAPLNKHMNNRHKIDKQPQQKTATTSSLVRNNNAADSEGSTPPTATATNVRQITLATPCSSSAQKNISTALVPTARQELVLGDLKKQLHEKKTLGHHEKQSHKGCEQCKTNMRHITDTIRHLTVAHEYEKTITKQWIQGAIDNQRPNHESVVKTSHNNQITKHQRPVSVVPNPIRSIPEKPKPSPRKGFSCNLCPRNYPTNLLLVRHQSTHYREKTFICKICNDGFWNKILLDEHKNLHETPKFEKSFKCEICNYRLVNQNQLQFHKISFHSTESIEKFAQQCRVCNKMILHSVQLAAHESMCGKKYKCPKCNISFSKLAFKEHLRTHTGEKPYTCQVCLKSFNRRSTIKLHLTRHEKVLGKKLNKDMRCPLNLTEYYVKKNS